MLKTECTPMSESSTPMFLKGEQIVALAVLEQGAVCIASP
jgi:hypothetical protein